MNIALEQAKEFVDGKLRRNYGDAFVRGNNGQDHPKQNLLLQRSANLNSDVHFRGLIRHDKIHINTRNSRQKTAGKASI